MAENRTPRLRGALAGEHFLKPTKRSTPCVGICSTSHGDLVCRGCKRFYNEVRDWQEFTDSQRDMVTERLLRVKKECLESLVRVVDYEVLYARTEEFIQDTDGSLAFRLYEALSHCQDDFEAWGICETEQHGLRPSAHRVLRQVENEFYNRSYTLFRRYFR